MYGWSADRSSFDKLLIHGNGYIRVMEDVIDERSERKIPYIRVMEDVIDERSENGLP